MTKPVSNLPKPVAKKKKKSGKNSVSPYEVTDGSLNRPVNKLYRVRDAVTTTDLAIESRKISEITELLWLPEQLEEKEKNARMVRAVELFESLKPEDGAESMLAAQMVGTHSAALECLRRAAISNQTFEGREQSLRHAQKLMALYTKQLDTLNKHRGKGQQKVTVEHVNVAPGGQAIVGTVNSGVNGQSDQPAKPVAEIDHRPEMSMETISTPEHAKSDRDKE